MKLPNRLYVLGVKYALKQKIGLAESGSFGECSPAKKKIDIDSNIKIDEDILETLGHEIMHAYLYESSMHNLFDEKTEEALCDLVGRLIKDCFVLKR